MQIWHSTRIREDSISAQSVRAKNPTTLLPASTKAGPHEIAGFGDQVGTSISYSVGLEKNK